MNLLLSVLSVLFLPFKIASLPAEVSSWFLVFLGYLADGVAIVAAYTDFAFLMVLVGIAVTISGIVSAYHILMWILKKIPFLGIH